MTKRKWKRWILPLLGIIVLLLIIARPILGRIVKGKLISMVEGRTDATLRVGSVTYLPLYGVRVDDAEFLVPDQDGTQLQMLKVKRLELKLAKLPLTPGPLVIERVTITSPDIRLIQTPHGLLGLDGVMKSNDVNQTVKNRLSDLFELRHFSIQNGSFTFEDRTRPGSLPLVWKDLNVATEIAPSATGVYSYDFNGGNGSVAALRAAGTFDIDNLLLDVKHLTLKVQVDQGNKESAVPAQVQELLRKYGVQGRLAIDGAATVPLKKPKEASYRFDVALDDAQGRVPHYGRPIQKLAARVRVAGKADAPISTQLTLEATSGPTVFHVDQGDVSVDLHKKTWDLRRLSIRADASAVGVRSIQTSATAPSREEALRAGGKFELTAAGTGTLAPASLQDFRDKLKFEAIGTALDFHMQPPGFDIPIRLVTGAPITLNQDVLRISNLTGRYGNDQFLLTTLRLPLRDLPRIIRVDQISASATFDRDTHPYPGVVGQWITKVKPAGPFEIGGNVSYDFDGSPKLDYHLLAHTDRGAIEYTDQGRRIPISRIHLDALVDRGAAQLDYFQGNLFGGLLSATGSAKIDGPLTWAAKATLRDFDLRTAVQSATGKQFDTEKLAGRAFLRFDLTGGLKPESIKGTAKARLIDAKLFENPILSAVLGKAGMGKGLVASEAAATVAIADAKVNIKRMAVGSPEIGAQGTGTVGFDQSLDLDIVLAPLGEWDKTLKRTGVPFLSKALGEVAGAVQSAINAAASTLLYEFHVTGTTAAPKVTPVPAPILSKGTAAIFTTMLGGGEKGTTLEDAVGKTDPEEKNGK